MGDLNVDFLKQDHQAIKDVFKTNGFTQLLTTPTRVTEKTATLRGKYPQKSQKLYV